MVARSSWYVYPLPMPNKLTLAFTVNVANTSYGPAKASAALQAVPLYANPSNDPVLGQFLGLTVASDTPTVTSTTATRTIVLNMANAQAPTAPPAFPCNPLTAVPPVLKDPTIGYYGETGLFLVGDTVTGFTSTAHAVVAEIDDNGSGSGTLYLVPGSTIVGNFLAGEVLTGTGGAMAKAATLDYIAATATAFATGDTVTGGTSGATGVVASATRNAQGAGVLTFSTTTSQFAFLETLTATPSGATGVSGTAVGSGSHYQLLTSSPLPGTFLTTPGSGTVSTSFSQVPSLSVGSIVQFLAQMGVFYTVQTVGASSITLTTTFTGTFSANAGALLMTQVPKTLTAIYSTSPLDSAGVAITPALPAGSGARTVSLTYFDSTGAGPFTVTTSLMGTYPSPVTLHAGSINIAIITDMHVATVGGFGNSVGQITLCELSAVPAVIPVAFSTQQFQTLIDETQMLIVRGLVYLPPSYFALSQQDASQPWNPLTAGALLGTFQLVQGGTSVATSVNQSTGPALATGNTIEFAAQEGVIYTVKSVGSGTITLTTPFTGLNDNPILSSATLLTPSPAAEPTNAQLSGAVGEFVNPGTAVPPPALPLAPQTMTPSPTFLSGMFARTLQLSMAVPVSLSTIVLS
jgi:hypothetical protein